MLRAPLLLIGIGIALPAAACSSASGDVAGGALRFDASAPLATGDGGGATLCFSAAGDAGSGNATWTGIFNDYFGGTARSACGGQAGCHASAHESGALASNYVCPPTDKDACYTSITGQASGLVDSTNPQGSLLFLTLRKTTAVGTNKMPRAPICSFSDADVKRITDWMSAGAKND